jgi:hypothetical protein
LQQEAIWFLVTSLPGLAAQYISNLTAILVRLVIRTRVHLLPFGTIPWHSRRKTGLT